MSETLSILVVDDEPGMQMGVARTLRDFSVQVPDVAEPIHFVIEQAGSGEEALEKIAQSPPHILLLDYKLPGMTGLDVLEKVSGDAAELLTIMITAYASLETAVTATRRGAYDFLAKPFTPGELKNTVRKAAVRIVLARQARKLAAEKRQVRFQFISVLAHELKAPLAAIEGYLHIIQERSAGDDPASYARMIDRSLVRLEGMRKMIVDLLDLTHIESGQKRRQLETVDLAAATQAVRETFMPQASERGIQIEIAASGDTLLPADKSEIEIILNNLVSNALKYNRDGGKVNVNIAGDASAVTLTVADTGIGMSAEDAARLFNDFVRIKNEKTRNILGSGLGLSIVKKLAMLYGGEATVTSTPDVGSTFTVRLSRTAQENDAETR